MSLRNRSPLRVTGARPIRQHPGTTRLSPQRDPLRDPLRGPPKGMMTNKRTVALAMEAMHRHGTHPQTRPVNATAATAGIAVPTEVARCRGRMDAVIRVRQASHLQTTTPRRTMVDGMTMTCSPWRPASAAHAACSRAPSRHQQ